MCHQPCICGPFRNPSADNEPMLPAKLYRLFLHGSKDSNEAVALKPSPLLEPVLLEREPRHGFRSYRQSSGALDLGSFWHHPVIVGDGPSLKSDLLHFPTSQTLFLEICFCKCTLSSSDGLKSYTVFKPRKITNKSGSTIQ
jgi:hypothetical protein